MLSGGITVETPAHVVVHSAEGFEIRKYPAAVGAAVRDEDAEDARAFSKTAFPTLARYIGVFGKPQNVKRGGGAGEGQDGESVSMTAPVVMSGDSEQVSMTAPVVMSGESEKVSMTAPVVMSGEGEKVDMTAPVVMSEKRKGMSMMFLLPAKYQRVEDAPVPTDPAVTLEMVPGGRCEAVLQFSGNIAMGATSDRAKELFAMLERDGIRPTTGEYTYQGYNPPFTLPWCKRNEIHVEVDPSSFEAKPDE